MQLPANHTNKRESKAAQIHYSWRLAGPRNPAAETISRSLILKDSPVGESILVVNILWDGVHPVAVL
jgi:hypothetical protein